MYILKRFKHKLQRKSKQKLSTSGIICMICQQVIKQMLNLVIPGLAASISTILFKGDMK